MDEALATMRHHTQQRRMREVHDLTQHGRLRKGRTIAGEMGRAMHQTRHTLRREWLSRRMWSGKQLLRCLTELRNLSLSRGK
jgi:hypothetical protein